MILVLTAKNKVGFIDGSLVKPVAASEAILHSWTRSNNMVISWISNSISKDIAESVIYINTGEEMWLDLKDRFSQKNSPHIFQL
jgi:hypothetical protein